MSLKTWTSGLAFAAALVGCSPEQAETPTPVAEIDATETDAGYESYLAFANEAFVVDGASEADLTSLTAALPDYVRITWDSKSFEADTGATVIEGLKIALGGESEFGLEIESAKLWGYDDRLLVDRLSGERFDDAGPLFSRMEGSNASYFGVAVAFNSLIDETLVQLDAEMPDGFEFGVDRFDSTTERFVLSDVSLLPWELSPIPAEWITDFDEDIPQLVIDAVHTGQWLMALSRSLGVEKSVSFDTDVAFEIRQPGAESTASFTYEVAAAEGLRGFDLGKSLIWGYSGTQTNAYTDAMAPGEVISFSGFPAGFSMAQTESYATSEISDLRLNKLMGYLVRSELPSMAERDLMSLGAWRVTDYVSQLDDKTILTAESAYFNGDSFEWLIPSDLNMGMTGATLNTGELTDFFYVLFETFVNESSIEPMDEEEAAQFELVREGVAKAIQLLPEHGLDQVPFNASISASWEADTGPTDFALRWDSDGFSRSELNLAISLPIYDALQAAFESDDREVAFEEAFRSAFAFRGARWFEEDKGGYDKLFGFAHALGKEYPDEGWGAMLGNMEPAQMRTYLGTMTRMGSSAAAAEFPPAADWIDAVASYLEAGGTLEFASDPPSPITEAMFDGLDQDPTPEEVVEILGLTVTHTN
ncbi:MAG: hypothetical protein AAFV37_11180 [Pseudomonadota bacterium]